MTSNNLPKHKDKVLPERKNSDINFHNHNFNSKTSFEPTPEQEEWLKKEMRGVEIVQNKKTRERKSEVIAYKYSNKGKGELRESVFIEGIPYFIKYFSNPETRKDYLLCESKIEEPTRVIKPPQPEECPYEPYEFKDIHEPNYYLQRAKNETINSIYKKIETIVKGFNDRDSETIALLSAYTLCSYFQDKFSTVPYLDVTGDNGTGKSAFGDTFESLGYRTVNMTDPTPANWFRVLGSIEFGQVTIVADEADRIDDSPQVMSILKTGYQIKGKVPRMDTDNKKQEWYYAYCMKIILHEKSLDATSAKGILDRCFPINSVKGFPQYDIKEVRNPQGNMMRQKHLDEIIDLRKLLLVYKLVHSYDPLPEVEIGLDGRDRELCKPTLQLFCGFGASKELIEKIEEALEHFIRTKNNIKENSLEALVYPVIANAISQYGNIISTGQMWKSLIETLEGELDEKNPNVFYSADYGVIYRNITIKMISDKFGARMKHRKNGNEFSFNPDYVIKIGKIYGEKNGIQTKLVSGLGDAGDAGDGNAVSGQFPALHGDKIDNENLIRNSHENHDLNNEIDDKRAEIGLPPTQDESPESPESPISDSSESSGYSSRFNFDCYECIRKKKRFRTNDSGEYQKHWLKHKIKATCYPGKADLEEHGWKSQDKEWEV